MDFPGLVMKLEGLSYIMCQTMQKAACAFGKLFYPLRFLPSGYVTLESLIQPGTDWQEKGIKM